MDERRADYPQLLTEVKGMREQLDTICLFINGNGQLGVKVRIDRLEQTEQGRVWAWRMLVTTVIGLVLKAGLEAIALAK